MKLKYRLERLRWWKVLFSPLKPFTIELLQDWGVASSLFEAMWADAESAPNTTLTVAFTAVTGAVFTFSVLPIFPAAGGAAPSALTDTWTMTVVGTPTENFS